MTVAHPIVCIPGLACSSRLYAEQIPHLWTIGPVTIARHTQHRTITEIVSFILSSAPEKFALIGLSMGGYISFEIMRQAPERVTKLALLDTSARADTPEQSRLRRSQISLAPKISPSELFDDTFTRLVHPSHHDDQRLRQIFRQMGEETGIEGFINQQTAIMGRVDSRPTLSAIHCPTLVLVGNDDQLTPPEIAAEIADGIAGAVLVNVPNCGHASTLDQPDMVTKALVGFLKG